MSDPKTPADDDLELTRQLEEIMGRQLGRIRQRFLLHGLGVLAFALGGLAIVYYGVDRLLQLPPAVRVLLSVAVMAYLLVLLRRRLLYPLQRAFTRNDVALALEERFPELRQKLISALQLGRSARAHSLRSQSEAMVHKVLEDAREHIATVPHKQLLNPVQTGKVWAAAASVLLIIGLGAMDNRTAVGVFLQRILGMDVAYPMATRLFVELPQRPDDGQSETVEQYGPDGRRTRE